MNTKCASAAFDHMLLLPPKRKLVCVRGSQRGITRDVLVASSSSGGKWGWFAWIGRYLCAQCAINACVRSSRHFKLDFMPLWNLIKMCRKHGFQSMIYSGQCRITLNIFLFIFFNRKKSCFLSLVTKLCFSFNKNIHHHQYVCFIITSRIKHVSRIKILII